MATDRNVGRASKMQSNPTGYPSGTRQRAQACPGMFKKKSRSRTALPCEAGGADASRDPSMEWSYARGKLDRRAKRSRVE
jgi:hypothetical protein